MTFTNLPVQLTSFIGRERELEEIEHLVSTSRLVTLTGAGGCGKTRLAIQVANHSGELSPDGVWLVDFVPLHEPALVPQHVAQTLGLRPAPDQPLTQLLLNFMRPKQMLLLLDNCEHLIGAISEFVQQSLFTAVELKILATSRQPLTVPGEKIYQVQGLTLPSFDSATFDPQDLKQYDAVHLFVQRAQSISPHFKITPENAFAIVEICRRLDGIPLALELASARLNILTPQQIVERLDDRFVLLNSGQLTGVVTHHQTLRAAIDWSYDLLSAEEQTLLSRLAVFDAGFSLDTAEGVCTGDGIPSGRTLDLLSSLVDKSLVIAETTGRAEARYRLLETIREYALEKLKEAGEFEQLRDRHLDFFVVRIEEIVSKLQSSSYQLLWINLLDSELDNIRSALEWALQSDQIESGLRLVITLFDFWISHGSISEGRNWYERLLAKADEQVPIMLRARANFNAGMTAAFMGDATAARSHERIAVALCEAAGEEGVQLLASAQAPIIVAAIMDRDFLTAYNITERTVQLLQEINDQLELPMSLGTLAVAAGGLGQFQLARSLAEASLQGAHKSGNLFAAALMVSYLGYIEHCEQNYEGAQALYEESLTAIREQGATHEEPRVVQSLAHTRLQQGDLDQAYALICESVALYRNQGELKAMGECLISFGVLAFERGMPAEAVRLLTTGATHGRSVYVSLLLAEGREYERYLAKARSQLSEQEFEQAQEAGRIQTLEQAIEYALSLPLGPAGSASKEKDEFGGLTEREREIAALIGEGNSNGEIATELVLSKRTVEKHVANILSKLELTSRAQIVRWAMEHHLTSKPSV